MACVAFDLDNTLGFFDIIKPLALLWDEGSHPISHLLKRKLQGARSTFATYLLNDPKILATLLRPNLDAMILPLLQAKQSRRLKTVIIYSNTGVGYSVELAIFLIETIYKCPRFFALGADAWHPLRKLDHKDDIPGEYTEPYKTIETLQLLFQKAMHSKKSVPLRNILFVDDRRPKHVLKAQEVDGLTYIVPSRFIPTVTDQQKRYILFMAYLSLEQNGLLTNKEYLASKLCNRDNHIRGFTDLFAHVSDCIEGIHTATKAWVADTASISSQMREFLHQIQP